MKIQPRPGELYEIEVDGLLVASKGTYRAAREWAEVNAPAGWEMYKTGVQSRVNKSTIGTHWAVYPDEWEKIAIMYDRGVSIREIAEKYGVCKQTIQKIKNQMR